jgi:hypothetical protein
VALLLTFPNHERVLRRKGLAPHRRATWGRGLTKPRHIQTGMILPADMTDRYIVAPADVFPGLTDKEKEEIFAAARVEG